MDQRALRNIFGQFASGVTVVTCANAEGTPHGATVRCELDGEVPLVADVTATAFAELHLAPGSAVWAAVKASEVAVYER